MYEDHREIGKFCGSRVPHNLTTEWNVLKLEHHRTFFIGETGFRSVYFAAEGKRHAYLLKYIAYLPKGMGDIYVNGI